VETKRIGTCQGKTAVQDYLCYVCVISFQPLGRPSRGWEDNIKMDLQEVECGGMDWIELAQDRER